MNEQLPAPCEHCNGTGMSHGAECLECRGKGYRLIVTGVPLLVPLAEKSRRWQGRPAKRR